MQRRSSKKVLYHIPIKFIQVIRTENLPRGDRWVMRGLLSEDLRAICVCGLEGLAKNGVEWLLLVACILQTRYGECDNQAKTFHRVFRFCIAISDVVFKNIARKNCSRVKTLH